MQQTGIFCISYVLAAKVLQFMITNFFLLCLQSSSTEEDTTDEKISVVFAALDLAVEVNGPGLKRHYQ
jgi:hypothetical protein